MTTEHTPGSWDIDLENELRVGCAVHGRTGIHPIAAMAVRDGLPIETARANAKLIAAAPDLLEALRDIVEEGIDDYWSECNPEKVNRALAAIRKATT